MNPVILFTIDVEDWFQVENFKRYIPFSTWSSRELRVEKNTHCLLDLFDSINLENSSNKEKNSEDTLFSHISDDHPRATFFILGWIAERLPSLIREIHARGHEVASHGYLHKLCRNQSHEDFVEDLNKSKNLLEHIIGAEILGYRAPSFSISEETLKVISRCGYKYDSSYNSFSFHGRYGRLSPRDEKIGIAYQVSDNLFELPVSNISVKGGIIPWGGGAYFRLIPFFIFKLGVRALLANERAYLFYIHPWEIDSRQPRIMQASSFSRFKHYTNLKLTKNKLDVFTSKFNYCRFVTCSQYINSFVSPSGTVETLSLETRK